MLIVLLRHGETAYNAQRRYQGASDIPLSEAGKARLRKADFAPEVVYVTSLCRTAQTAAILFPGARQAVEDGLREMDFGDFEGRTYDTLTFDFSKLSGDDDIAIENELQALGKPVVVAEMSGEYQIRLAARACKERLGVDAFTAMPLRDFRRIRNRVRSFLLSAGI